MEGFKKTLYTPPRRGGVYNDFTHRRDPSGVKTLMKNNFHLSKPTTPSIQIGESLLLKNIPIGTSINCIELKKGQGAKIARSAGTYGILLKTLDNNKSIIKLPSNKIIEINSDCTAVIGQVSNPLHRSIIFGKAGASR